MSDISTFARWKDWLLLALIALVFTLLGLLANENRERIVALEAEIVSGREVRQQGFERIRALEAQRPPFDRNDAREIEERLQRQIDTLGRQVEDLRQRVNGR